MRNHIYWPLLFLCSNNHFPPATTLELPPCADPCTLPAPNPPNPPTPIPIVFGVGLPKLDRLSVEAKPLYVEADPTLIIPDVEVLKAPGSVFIAFDDDDEDTIPDNAFCPGPTGEPLAMTFDFPIRDALNGVLGEFTGEALAYRGGVIYIDESPAAILPDDGVLVELGCVGWRPSAAR